MEQTTYSWSFKSFSVPAQPCQMEDDHVRMELEMPSGKKMCPLGWGPPCPPHPIGQSRSRGSSSSALWGSLNHIRADRENLKGYHQILLSFSISFYSWCRHSHLLAIPRQPEELMSSLAGWGRELLAWVGVFHRGLAVGFLPWRQKWPFCALRVLFPARWLEILRIPVSCWRGV